MRRSPLLFAVLLFGCADPLPDALGDCADGTDLTWSEVEPLFAEHCTSCHSSQLDGAAREGAPSALNYDTPEAAMSQAFSAWIQIRRGSMPVAGPMPDEDAVVLWEWFSCGGPL
jgi:uncharacterized membrane protein